MSFLYAWIFALSISLTIAVSLDGVCNNDTQCDGGNKTLCRNQKCQCNTPWYKPCNLTCELNRGYAYQGEECREEGNCIGNTICQANKCECRQGYTPKNGVCFKNLKEVCANNDECWSNYCSNFRCACALDHETIDNGTNCRRKLVNVYNTWTEANAANEFCVDKNSCKDILAECYNDTRYPASKFCKCPIGFKINADKQCEAIKGQLLSPLDSIPSNYGECGNCEDNNAACIEAGNQRTCWCRTGYVKDGNQCVKQNPKTLIIFPNLNDLELHSFTSDCKTEANSIEKNKLCVCSPGYKFIAKDRPCEKIQRDWIDDIYEYGLCTRINSGDVAIPEDGQCPKPLTCEAREDKHVCSCGIDQFLDPNNRTQCVYKIGTKTNSINDTCPKYAERNSTSGICECLPGYKATTDNRQCEIKLLSIVFNPSSCDSNRSNDKICQDQFGKKVLLCNIGECRCSGNESYPNDDNTQCYAPVNTQLTLTMENCPPNSTPTSGRCNCNSGYISSNDSRQCVLLGAQLIEYVGPSTNTIGDLTTAVCRSLFTGPVESYNNSHCQCKNETFINDNKNGCWYKLEVILTAPEQTLSCPPNSTTESGQQCKCDGGFTANNNKCVQITDRVFMDKNPAAKNITGLTEYGCIKWFGRGASKSTNGDYCICRSDAYPVQSDTFCHFFINTTNNVLKRPQDCPDNTIIYPETSPSACVCKAGYYMSSDNRTCGAFRNINLEGSIDMEVSYTTNCVNFTNDDCIASYGEQAFCKDDKCFCNRQLSFVNADGKCESFSNNVYPGEHELSLYSCNTDDDCGDEETVICDYFNTDSGYKVCKCQNGALLDPKTQKCMTNRCINCDEKLNFECYDYQCSCKDGYYLDGTACVQNTRKLELYQSCDSTIFGKTITNNSLQCDSNCQRAKCSPGHRPENSNCVRYELGKDRCIHQESICSEINENSICIKDTNECLCLPSYYLTDNTCARAVGSLCSNAEECGFDMICKGQRCACNDKQHEEETNDSFGRLIKRCVKNADDNSGIDQIRFNPVLLLLFVLIQVFFV